MDNKGSYKFKKPVDKTPAEYAPMKVTMRKKLELSDLTKKNDNKNYWLLYGIVVAYIGTMIGIWYLLKWILL